MTMGTSRLTGSRCEAQPASVCRKETRWTPPTPRSTCFATRSPHAPALTLGHRAAGRQILRVGAFEGSATAAGGLLPLRGAAAHEPATVLVDHHAPVLVALPDPHVVAHSAPCPAGLVRRREHGVRAPGLGRAAREQAPSDRIRRREPIRRGPWRILGSGDGVEPWVKAHLFLQNARIPKVGTPGCTPCVFNRSGSR